MDKAADEASQKIEPAINSGIAKIVEVKEESKDKVRSEYCKTVYHTSVLLSMALSTGSDIMSCEFMLYLTYNFLYCRGNF